MASNKRARPRSQSELVSKLPVDPANLPLEVAFKIWERAVINNEMNYEEATLLGKTYRQLNSLLRAPGHNELWQHLWNHTYGRPSNLEWDLWLGADLPLWAESWKSYFFWSLFIERMTSTVLGHCIWHNMEDLAQRDREIHSHDLAGKQGPRVLLVEQAPVVPLGWRYIEGHVEGTTWFVYHYETRRRFLSVDAVMDAQIADRNLGVPIFLSLWVYLLYHFNDRGDDVDDDDGWLWSVKFEDQVRQTVGDRTLRRKCVQVFNAFVEQCLVQHPNHIYFRKIASVNVFRRNPLSNFFAQTVPDFLANAYAIYHFAVEPRNGKLSEPREEGEDDKIYVGSALADEEMEIINTP